MRRDPSPKGEIPVAAAAFEGTRPTTLLIINTHKDTKKSRILCVSVSLGGFSCPVKAAYARIVAGTTGRIGNCSNGCSSIDSGEIKRAGTRSARPRRRRRSHGVLHFSAAQPQENAARSRAHRHLRQTRKVLEAAARQARQPSRRPTEAGTPEEDPKPCAFAQGSSGTPAAKVQAGKTKPGSRDFRERAFRRTRTADHAKAAGRGESFGARGTGTRRLAASRGAGERPELQANAGQRYGIPRNRRTQHNARELHCLSGSNDCVVGHRPRLVHVRNRFESQDRQGPRQEVRIRSTRTRGTA